MTYPDTFPLTQLVAELHRRRLLNPVPTYRAIYNATLDGRIPAQQIRGRWYWRSLDLPKIVAALQPTPRRRPAQ